jgi:Holliday junction DNA helicase RuvA
VIGRLSGTIVERAADGSCILDVGGVGYEVFVPLGALGRMTGADEVAVTLFVHTHVREDALVLYGFASRADREAFRALLGVSSVGPKLALAIMNVLDADRLARAISAGDKAAFKGIPGVGRKTVERLLLDLKDKLRPGTTTAAPASMPAAPPAPDGPTAIVVGALMQMGYKQAEAEKAAANVGEGAEDKPVEVLLREALSSLG